MKTGDWLGKRIGLEKDRKVKLHYSPYKRAEDRTAQKIIEAIGVEQQGGMIGEVMGNIELRELEPGAWAGPCVEK